jgi:hypothetical protein
MSLLNLNNGNGSSPRLKRGVKLWIGAGLIAAIAGIGSTLATNISLNNGDNTEFGQGVAQTVFCGASEANVIVTPTSTYVNSEIELGRAAVASVWVSPTWSGTPTFQEVSSDDDRNRFTSNYINDATGISQSVKGYWVTSRSSSTWYTSSNAPSSGFVFVPQAVGTSSTSYSSRSLSSSASGSNKYGYWKFQNWVPGSFTEPVAATDDEETNDSFELSGISITNIPDDCAGIDFVVSIYSSGDEDPKTIVSNCDNGRRGEDSYSNEVNASGSSCDNKVREIAVQWENTNDDTPNFSIDRLVSTIPSWLSGLLEVKTTAVVSSSRGGAINIKIDSDGSRLETGNFNKLVVETQDDLIGN